MMDSFLLLFVSLFLRQSTTFLRITAASAAGSVYCCIYTVLTVYKELHFGENGAFFPEILQSIASTIISYILVCMLMIFLAFGIHSKHILMKNIAVLYGAALFTGGVFQILGNLVTPNNHFAYSAQEQLLPHSLLRGWFYFGLFMGAALLAALVLCRGWHRQQGLSGSLYDISLEFGNKSVGLRVLLDTGNQLYEPKGGRPVTVIEKEAADKIFEDAEWEKNAGKVLSVPFHSLGREDGKLMAVVADLVIIRQGGTVWQYTDAVIGIYPGQLCKDRKYRGILHPEMLRGAGMLCSGKRFFSL